MFPDLKVTNAVLILNSRLIVKGKIDCDNPRLRDEVKECDVNAF